MASSIATTPVTTPVRISPAVRRLPAEIWGEIVAWGKADADPAHRPLAWPLARALPGLSGILQVLIALEKAHESVAGRYLGRSWLLQPRFVYPGLSDQALGVLRDCGSLAINDLPLRGSRVLDAPRTGANHFARRLFEPARVNTVCVPQQQQNFAHLLRACGSALVRLDLTGCDVYELYRDLTWRQELPQASGNDGETAPVSDFDWDLDEDNAVERFAFDWTPLTQLRHLVLKGISASDFLLETMDAVAQSRRTPWKLDVLDISGTDVAALLQLGLSWQIRHLVADELDLRRSDPFERILIVENVERKQLPTNLESVSLVQSRHYTSTYQHFFTALTQALIRQEVHVSA